MLAFLGGLLVGGFVGVLTVALVSVGSDHHEDE